MLELAPRLGPGRTPQILFLGAHSDDIEIGCGATALRLAHDLPGARVHWVVLTSEGRRGEEARASASEFLAGFDAGRTQIEVLDFRNAFFPGSFTEIKEFFEDLKSRSEPDIVFTHHKHDLHQDHRVVGELTWNTFRNHWILEYEVPKYDGGLTDPNLFVPAEPELCEQKIGILLKHFGTQRSKHWFTRDLFLGLMRLRGMESSSPSGFAEAFHCRKVALAW